MRDAAGNPLVVAPPTTGPLGDHAWRKPRFTVEAVSFLVLDETGVDFLGSDEVAARFESNGNTMFTGIHGDSDTGDTQQFRSQQRCIYPAADPDGSRNRAWACAPSGGAGPLTFTITLYELDGFVRVLGIPDIPPGFSLCGVSDIQYACAGEEIQDRSTVIGKSTATYTEAQLGAAMPTLGSTLVRNLRISSSYDVKYMITRVADAGIAPPEVVQPTPPAPISLSVSFTLGNGGGQVTLMWSGAMTNVVDIYRNGSKILSTVNDGTHVDAVPAGTYSYRVCHRATTVCSYDVPVVVG
jgi:hypothetical protein